MRSSRLFPCDGMLLMSCKRRMSGAEDWRGRSNFYKNVWNKNMFGPVRKNETIDMKRSYLPKHEMDNTTSFWMEQTELRRRTLLPKSPEALAKENHSKLMQAWANASVDLDHLKEEEARGRRQGGTKRKVTSIASASRTKPPSSTSSPTPSLSPKTSPASSPTSTSALSSLWPSDMARPSSTPSLSSQSLKVLQLRGWPTEFPSMSTLKDEAHTYPSITKILDVSMPDERREALKAWELSMVAKMGIQGFKEYKENLLTRGKRLHRHLQEYFLLNKPLDPSSEDDEVSQLHLKSVLRVLKHFSGALCLESHVLHPELKYKGILDCVAMKGDGKLVLVEWKTSEKKKRSLTQAFDAPLQVAAYVGAFNNDPRYNALGTIDKAVVVHIYNDGSVADSHEMDSHQLECQWKLFVDRLTTYHHKLNAT